MNNYPLKDSTRKKGDDAELLAIEYLKNKNFEIIKRNFHFGKYGELDIVAQDKKVLVFVEVRSKSNDKFGDPIDSITYSKQMKLRRAAEGYLFVNKIVNQECRFDVITIDLSKSEPEIKHYINAM